MYLLVEAQKLLLLVSLAIRMGREQARQCLCRLAHSAAELQGRGLHVRVSCCSIILTADACRSFASPASRAGLALQLQQACGERCCGHAFPLLWLTAKLCTKTHLHFTHLEGLWHALREPNAHRLLELQVGAISNHSHQGKIQSSADKS